MKGKRGHQQGSGNGQVNMPDSSSKPRSLTGHENNGIKMELKDKGYQLMLSGFASPCSNSSTPSSGLLDEVNWTNNLLSH